MLVLDDLHVDRRNTRAREAGGAEVSSNDYVEPDDLVAVVYTGVRPDAAQDFTSDRRLMLAAIDKFIGRKLPPATVERMEQYNTLFRARGAPRFEDLRDKQDGERAFNARSAMASIESISALLARVTGRRKAALVFSEGIDYDLAGLRTRGRSAAVGPTVLAPTTARRARPRRMPWAAPTCTAMRTTCCSVFRRLSGLRRGRTSRSIRWTCKGATPRTHSATWELRRPIRHLD